MIKLLLKPKEIYVSKNFYIEVYFFLIVVMSTVIYYYDVRVKKGVSTVYTFYYKISLYIISVDISDESSPLSVWFEVM